ncbi:MAG: NusG domain II-containing protein [Lachnospiraceae bacterium]|nr:NusG domain II-containing protein [Lachnospiraceae bacterium]
MTRRLGKNDRWLLLILAVICIGICIFFYLQRGEAGAVAKVTIAGEVYGTYTLTQDQTIEIKIDGKVTNILKIQDGTADVTKASCPDHLCVHQKSISRENETIVCLPNQVVIEIEGAKASALDSMT